MRRWQRVVQRRGVARAQPRWKGGRAGSIADHIEARRLQLEVDLALGEVRAAVKGRHVAWQHELARRLHVRTESCGGWSAPTHHQVSYPADLRGSDHDLVRLDQDLAAARGWAAVVGNAAGDDRH